MKMSPMENVSRIALVALIVCTTAVVAAPYQELVPRKGYVPVYIREGDTPLSEIHPRLAKAFGEIASASLPLQAEAGSTQLERTDSSAPSTTAKESRGAVTDEEEVPATVVEAAKAAKESDIASFDVVKDAGSDETADITQQKDRKENASKAA